MIVIGEDLGRKLVEITGMTIGDKEIEIKFRDQSQIKFEMRDSMEKERVISIFITLRNLELPPKGVLDHINF